ncbi:hypothetical protein BDN71DRAFT_1504958 [Pleurotus eryngii]|uniref:Transmembrane protein n=1 Tax=Pleurotus eryngii TaxID=5323 RepID=A0A9P6DAG1_PLEER|nr:hypothetical protein BDN71DRAFT_1504958 [Pleurotus eryngii]
MTDWNSPEVIASNGDSYVKVLHTLFGLYLWEWVIFLDADWRYVKNIKRSPLSPMMFSFLNRYCLLAALISVLISLHLNATSEVNCRSLYLSINATLELASIGFTVRIVTLRRHSRLAPHLIAFFVACLGTQAWLLLPTDSTWLPELGCVITRVENSFSNIGHTFNAGYFLVLLAFVSWDYACPFDDVRRPSTASLKELCWFGVAFLASCTNAVFVWVHLNPVMVTIAILPSTIAISIASGRVLRLRKYSAPAPTLPTTTDILTATHSPHLRPRFSFRRWQLALRRPSTHEVLAGSDFQRLYSAPASQTGSCLGTSTSMEAANSTRPSSIILPSLISPSSTYNLNRASYDPSTHLDSASESSARGDRYDLDAQLGAAQRRIL